MVIGFDCRFGPLGILGNPPKVHVVVFTGVVKFDERSDVRTLTFRVILTHDCIVRAKSMDP